MSDEHAASEESAAHAPAAVPFTPEECSVFHEEDKQAAKSVVVLMCGVFAIGLILYSIVAYVVAG